MNRRILVVASLLVTVSLWATSAAAGELDYEPPFIELGLGTTNSETTVGNGGLTAGVSKDGDLTMISWPSPSYFDHMHYMTTNAPEARTLPRFGALERMGAFAALAFERTGQSTVEVSELRSADWDITADFLGEDTGIIETTFDNTDLGITIRQIDIVPSDHDVFIRRFLVERTTDSPVESASIIGYSNLSPNLSKAPQVAVWQREKDAIMHFHPGDTGVTTGLDAVLDPLDRNFGILGGQLEAQNLDETRIDAIAAEIDRHYAAGVYIAMSSQPAPVEFQIGEDHTDTCTQIDELADNVQALAERFPDKSLPAPPAVADMVRCGNFDPVQDPRTENEWSYTAEDAYDDMQDGALSGNKLAGGQVNTAIKIPLTFTADKAEASMTFAFSDTSTKAHVQLDWAKSQDLQTLQDDIVAADKAFLDSLWIPAEITGELRKFVKRTFLNLRVGTDRDSGAIVAAVSRQPSYQLDWPRDGAFFNIALDLAGQNELVTKRMQFYSDTIRQAPADPVPLLNTMLPGWPDDPTNKLFPPGSWEMNYYADGMTGGNIRLEIDNTALLVWAYIDHVGHVEGQARQDYIDQAWPTIKQATEWLHSWRDPATGLNWYANEDDHAEYTQGLQGASTTYGALVAAARLAKHIGEDELADKWLHRAGELKSATLEHMYVEGEGFYGLPGGVEGHPEPRRLGAGSPYWLSWPTHMFPKDDERFMPQLLSGLDKQHATVSGETPGGQYPTKVAISAALVLPDGAERDKAFDIAQKLAADIANPRTYTIGEHYSAIDSDDDGQWDDGWVNGVSTPHLWSMTLVYLTAVAYHHPEKFDAYDDVLPKVEVPEVEPPGGTGGDAGGDAGADAGPDAGADTGPGDEDDGGGEGEGCGCSQSSGGPTPVGVMFVVGVGVWVVRRRRDA